MSARYGYYLPLAETTFEEVRFLGLAPKTEGVGTEATQRRDKDGQPQWVLTALVKYDGGRPETESFTLSASEEDAARAAKVPELTPIALVGLVGGKWSRSGSDRTEWSFQVSGFRVL